MPEQEKRCGHCKEHKPATSEFFYRSNDVRHKDGFARSCKSCMRAYRLAKNVQVERVDPVSQNRAKAGARYELV